MAQPSEIPPERRALRRQIALAMLLSPALCVLPVLAFVAPPGGTRLLVFGVWGLITVLITAVVWRAAARLRAMQDDHP